MIHKKSTTLWTKDFSCITFATVLSCIGGEAMNLPVSLLVFDETKSSFLAAMVMVCGMLPDIFLPILVAPLIDKGNKKKWIVGLDILLLLLFVSMGLWISHHQFVYGLYLVFILAIGTISVFYRLAYDAWYPDLIPRGMEQKGFAVSMTLYPLVTIMMYPIAAFLYEKVSMGTLFFAVAGLTFASILLESQIKETKKASSDSYNYKQYLFDIKEGFLYLKKEKGIRNIYTYMSITNGTSNGIIVMTQAHFQTTALLNVTMLGFLKSAEMIGRILSGFFHYTKGIPVKKRYGFTKMVYVFYDVMDGLLLFLPYPLMVVNRFLCGTLGASSATIRETAVKSYLPEHMRARINAFFSVIFALGSVISQLLAGMLGELLPYRVAALLLAMIPLTFVFFLIILPKKENQPIYEATLEEQAS